MISPAKVTCFPLLPEVFREGLLYGLISKEEVTTLADTIIVAEDEPDYFYIELSLAADRNEQIEILTHVVIGLKIAIVQRIMLGIAYQKITAQTISRKMFAGICKKAAISGALYPVEDFELFEFEYYDELLFMADPNDFWEEKMAYLSRYSGFTLDNYSQWLIINSDLEVVLTKEQAEEDEVISKRNEADAKRARLKKRWTYILMGILTTLALAIVVFDYTAYVGKTLDSKLEADLYQTGLVYLMIFIPYFMLRVVYGVWRKVRWMR